MCLNPLLYLPPETAHKCALWAVRNNIVGRDKTPSLAKTVAGIRFPSPIGLSAGADKDAHALSGWRRVGFGFVEAGSVTMQPRDGNPKPRIWRLRKHNSVINWMGLPGHGLAYFMVNLKQYYDHKQDDLVVGVSVASPDGKIDELRTISAACSPLVDYLTLNASCPNLSHKKEDPAGEMKQHVQAVVSQAGNTPVFLKLGPTKSIESLKTMTSEALEAGAKGFVLTNTVPYPHHELLKDLSFNWPESKGGPVGGYSGPALLDITEFMVSHVRQMLGPDIPIIGVGGIQSAEDAQKIINAGADLIQLYTGFIYKGRALISDINQALV